MTATAKICHSLRIVFFRIVEFWTQMLIHSNCDSTTNTSKPSYLPYLSFDLGRNLSAKSVFVSYHCLWDENFTQRSRLQPGRAVAQSDRLFRSQFSFQQTARVRQRLLQKFCESIRNGA